MMSKRPYLVRSSKQKRCVQSIKLHRRQLRFLNFLSEDPSIFMQLSSIHFYKHREGKQIKCPSKIVKIQTTKLIFSMVDADIS